MRSRAFTFWLNLVWLIFIYERFIVKNPLQFYWEKIFSAHYFHSSFENHVPFQVLEDFSVENLETTPSTFLSKFSSKIHLSRIINYWGSIFTLYLTWGAFSLVFVLSVFFPFFLSSFLIFYWYFHWQTLKIHRISSPRFLPLLFNQSICTYQTDSWWDLFSLEICILFAFSLM